MRIEPFSIFLLLLRPLCAQLKWIEKKTQPPSGTSDRSSGWCVSAIGSSHGEAEFSEPLRVSKCATHLPNRVIRDRAQRVHSPHRTVSHARA
jgi:hypothetical protein